MDVSKVQSTYVSFHPGGWLEYYVYSFDAAEYDLFVFTASKDNLYMQVYVNDKYQAMKILPDTNDYVSYQETVVGTVTLNKGFNRIRINLKNNWSSNGLHFDKFVLTK